MPPESCTSNPSPLPPEPAVDLKAELPGSELGDSLPSLVWGHQNPLSHTGGVMLQTTALPLPRLALSLRAIGSRQNTSRWELPSKLGSIHTEGQNTVNSEMELCVLLQKEFQGVWFSRLQDSEKYVLCLKMGLKIHIHV